MDQKDLRRVRAALGLNGTDVCERVGFSRTKLSNLERGAVLATPEELSSIAATLKALSSKRETRKARDAVAAFAAEVGWRI